MIIIKNTKAFTLIEIIVSIALFSIIIIFLYQSFEMTKKTDLFYNNKVESALDNSRLKKILFMDLINKIEQTESITEDKNKNNIFILKSNNSYHNPFYENITYFVSKEKNLIRIESKDSFDKTKLNDDFFDNAYIDTLDSNITKFKVFNDGKNIYFYLLNEEKEKILFSF